MIGIVLGIAMFMLLVIIHELGHFWAAKKSGVKVKEFGIWIPPKICTMWTDKSGTEYTLNWIPLGGFVAMKWEDGSEVESSDQDTFQAAKLWKKLIIILAGVTMNIIAAFVIFTVIFTLGVRPISIIPDEVAGIKVQSFMTPSVSFLQQEGLVSENELNKPLIIDEVISWSLAKQLGLDNGDQIHKINGLQVSSYTITNILGKHTLATGNTLEIVRNDDWKIVTKNLTFDCGEECFLGIAYESPDLTIKMPFHRAALAALKEIRWEWNMTMNALANIGKKLFSTEKGSGKQALQQLSGPVGIVKTWSIILERNGLMTFFGLGAMISLALAFFNILPIPALDGGRFWTAILQHISGVKVEKFSQIEGWVNMFFFWLLMIIGIVILLKDLVMWRGLSLPFIG